MKEMQLFEIGFKEKYHHAGYYEKFYVVAENFLDAMGKARRWLVKDHEDWDDYDTPEDKAHAVEMAEKMEVAKLYHVGKAIT
ncbi:MAG: hypothetical protein AMJ70_08515 [Dehalococcoidia bacterium SG8_51_3]|nr:MAG: hypothetical protein AMJ70_08515 [Dehalococcoidia bacterium SG8_51_3]